MAWINGNIVGDRDRDNRDRKFGVSLGAGRVVLGVGGAGTGDATICGRSEVLDGRWHHVAVQRRRSDGRMEIWVDGALDTAGDGALPGTSATPTPRFPVTSAAVRVPAATCSW